MKILTVVFLSALFAFATARESLAASDHSIDEQTIIKLRDAVLKAYDAGDIKTLDQIEDSDFTLAGDFGQQTKQQHLDMVRHREKPQVVSRKIDNQFRFYGNVALLTEVDHSTDASGSADYQTTILWVRHGYTRRMSHMHFCQITAKP
jgi:hypothetical protein